MEIVVIFHNITLFTVFSDQINAALVRTILKVLNDSVVSDVSGNIDQNFFK